VTVDHEHVVTGRLEAAPEIGPAEYRGVIQSGTLHLFVPRKGSSEEVYGPPVTTRAPPPPSFP